MLTWGRGRAIEKKNNAAEVRQQAQQLERKLKK